MTIRFNNMDMIGHLKTVSIQTGARPVCSGEQETIKDEKLGRMSIDTTEGGLYENVSFIRSFI